MRLVACWQILDGFGQKLYRLQFKRNEFFMQNQMIENLFRVQTA